MKLNSTFRKISSGFNIEFEQLANEVEHGPSSGDVREHALAKLLTKYLPKRIAIDTGFVIDAHGSTSLQQDIVIYDNTVGTVFEVSSIKYFPCESVIAVGEVKARMDSSDKLDDALNKIFSAKNLDRSNSGRNELVTGPGISLDVLPFKPNDNYRDQIFSFIFTGKSMQRDSTLRKLQEFNQKKDPRVWPNLFCDYTKMLISYEVEGGLAPDPMTAKCLYCTEDSEIDDLLLLFYCILSSFVNRAHVARPNYFHYASMDTSKATYHSLKGG